MTVHANDAHPFPIYNARYRAIFPLLDADGDPVSPSAPDTELSQDTGTFADATNEATEIATASGVVYIDLINTETDCTSLVIKAASTGAKSTIMTLYPLRMPVLRTGTAQSGAATTITLDSGASAVDDYYNGCYVNITNNSPANVQGQARLITDYVGSSKVATVAAWGTNPSVASTFEVLVPPGMQSIMWAGAPLADPTVAGVPEVDLTHAAGTAITATGGRPEVNASHAAGTAWNSGAIGAATLASDTIAAAKIATGAITAAKFAAGAIDAAAIATDAIDADAIAANAIDAGAIATGAITAAKFAAGAIDAAAIATGAIDADALAADAVAEIADGVWDEIRSGHVTAGSYGQASLASAPITGTSDAGGSTVTIVDAERTESTTDVFNGSWAVLTSGAGAGAARMIVGFTPASDTISVYPGFPLSIGAGVTYAIVPAAYVRAYSDNFGLLDENAIADGVWDEIRSGHTMAGSYGQSTQATFMGAVASATSSTLVLGTQSYGSAASGSDDFYNGLIVLVIAGLGEGQQRTIVDYVGASKTITPDGDWTTTPDSTSKVVILGV